MPHKETFRVVAALILNKGKYLITQRKAKAVFPLFWEFPGGKVEKGETDEDALKREIREEMGVEIEIQAPLYEKFFSYSDFDIEFRVFRCGLKSPAIRKIGIEDFQWVNSAEFGNFRFPPADEDAMRQILGIEKK
jgi:8-oxo-dGTP diphosphatase